MLPIGPEHYMQEHNWEKVRWFGPQEKWGDPCKMRVDLIMYMDALRHYLGHPIHVNSGWRETGDRHPSGGAMDGYIQGVCLIDQFLLLERYPDHDKILGLGLYPHWNTPGVHIDMVKPGRWLAYTECIGKDEQGKPIYKQKYTALSWESIKKYCL